MTWTRLAFALVCSQVITVSVPASCDGESPEPRGLPVSSSPSDYGQVADSPQTSTVTTREWGFLDAQGNTAIPLKFQHARRFSEGLCAVKLNGLYGYIGHDGDFEISPAFLEADLFVNGRAVAKNQDDRYGFINTSGEFVIPPVFEYLGRFTDGRAEAQIGERCGYIDVEGKFVIAPEFELCTSYSEGIASVYDGNKWQFIDSRGKPFLPGFGDASEFSCGVVKVYLDGKDVLLNKAGARIPLPDGIDWASMYCENDRIEISANDKVGFADPNGEVAIDLVYDRARQFWKGETIVVIDERYGVIDTSGNWILEPEYGDLERFSDGLAYAEKSGRRGFIDRSGSFVFETELEVADFFSEGLVPVYRESKHTHNDGTIPE